MLPSQVSTALLSLSLSFTSKFDSIGRVLNGILPILYLSLSSIAFAIYLFVSFKRRRRVVPSPSHHLDVGPEGHRSPADDLQCPNSNHPTFSAIEDAENEIIFASVRDENPGVILEDLFGDVSMDGDSGIAKLIRGEKDPDGVLSTQDSYSREGEEGIQDRRAPIATVLRATWLARKDVFSLLCSMCAAGLLLLSHGDPGEGTPDRDGIHFGIVAWVSQIYFPSRSSLKPCLIQLDASVGRHSSISFSSACCSRGTFVNSNPKGPCRHVLAFTDSSSSTPYRGMPPSSSLPSSTFALPSSTTLPIPTFQISPSSRSFELQPCSASR